MNLVDDDITVQIPFSMSIFEDDLLDRQARMQTRCRRGGVTFNFGQNTQQEFVA